MGARTTAGEASPTDRFLLSSASRPHDASPFSFPRDDGAHENFSSEAWRVFGFFTSATGRRFDIAATFFRYASRANAKRANASAWSRPQIFAADFAVADRAAFHYVSRTRFERDGVGTASAASRRLDVSTGTWTLRGNGAAAWRDRRYVLRTSRDGAAIDLALAPVRAPIPLGIDGVEAVDGCATCRAFGYAYTRLRASGRVTIDGVAYPVRGSMWLDHEFGDRPTTENERATRVAIQFDDGRDVVATFANHDDGMHALNATLVRANGDIVPLTSGDTSLANFGGARWTSPATGIAYPSAPFLVVRSASLAVALAIGPRESEIVAPLGEPSYFDGAADVGRVDPPDGDHGKAFVEMTGYDRRSR